MLSIDFFKNFVFKWVIPIPQKKKLSLYGEIKLVKLLVQMQFSFLPNQAVLVQVNKGLASSSGTNVMRNSSDSSSAELFPLYYTGHKKCLCQTGKEVPVTGWRFGWTVTLWQKSKNTTLVLVQFWIRFNRLENNSSSSILVQVKMDDSEGVLFRFGSTTRFWSLEEAFLVLTNPFWLT